MANTEDTPTTIAGLLNSDAFDAEVRLGRRALIVRKLAPMRFSFEVYEAKSVGSRRVRIHEGEDEGRAVRALIHGADERDRSELPDESGLKLWNGRGGDWRGVAFCYVAARSAADAVRLLQAAGHSRMTRHELKVYFANVWGNPMNGIRRERGVWIQREGKSEVERVALPEGV